MRTWSYQCIHYRDVTWASWHPRSLAISMFAQQFVLANVKETSGSQFNIKMSSYQYRKSHCGDKTVVRSSYLHNGISYTGRTTSLYWIGAQSSALLDLCEGNSMKTAGFPAQRASNGENASIWSCHHTEQLKSYQTTLQHVCGLKLLKQYKKSQNQYYSSVWNYENY